MGRQGSKRVQTAPPVRTSLLTTSSLLNRDSESSRSDPKAPGPNPQGSDRTPDSQPRTETFALRSRPRRNPLPAGVSSDRAGAVSPPPSVVHKPPRIPRRIVKLPGRNPLHNYSRAERERGCRQAVAMIRVTSIVEVTRNRRPSSPISSPTRARSRGVTHWV